MSAFGLSARFCLYNCVCVLESGERKIVFGLKDSDSDERRIAELKEKLARSAMSHFKKNGIADGEIEFKSVSGEIVKNRTAIGYGQCDKDSFSSGSSELASCEKHIAKNASDASLEDDESVTVVLLDSLLRAAVDECATDIHIEGDRVRFRVAGILRFYCALSVSRGRELVRRIKAVAHLDLMENRRGQDGQFMFDYEKHGLNHYVSVRVSCVPCIPCAPCFFDDGESGESVVLRLLDSERVPLELSALGFSACQKKTIGKIASSDFGLILLCGATGSGKSTTAASILALIQERSGGGKKIITIEDPPEYVLSGMTQIRVDAKSGMDFSDALRFVFRQDPDVIFVGEVRDEKTAQVCIRSSLTGHLVLATLHTSSVEAAYARLRGFGIAECDISSALKGIIMQRLSFDSDGGKIKLEADVREI